MPAETSWIGPLSAGGATGEIRADHVLTLWGATFLRLHYRLRVKAPVGVQGSPTIK